MHLLITVAVVLQVISAVAIIVLATGSANFLSRSTAVASTIFFCATLALTFGGQVRKAPAAGGVLSTVTTEQKAPAQPASPVPATNTSDFTNKPAQNQIPR